MSQPTNLQLDALREVANIGCGQAASALSRLMGGRRVDIGVPRALLADGDELVDLLGGPESSVVSVSFGLEGDLAGRLLMVLPEEDAHRLVGLLLNAPGDGRLREDQRSALSETANILASACLSAISKLTNFKLIPSIPSLVEDTAGAVLDQALAGMDEAAPGEPGRVAVLEADFSTQGTATITGQLLLITDLANLTRLLERLGV